MNLKGCIDEAICLTIGSRRLADTTVLIHLQRHMIRLLFDYHPRKGDFARWIDGVPDAAPQPHAARAQRLMKRTLTRRIELIRAAHQQTTQPGNIGGTKHIPPVHVPVFIAFVVKAIVRVLLQLTVPAGFTFRHDVIPEREDVSGRAVRHILDGQVEQRSQWRTATHQTTRTCRFRHSGSAVLSRFVEQGRADHGSRRAKLRLLDLQLLLPRPRVIAILTDQFP
jgi:hypothetical protein